MVIDKNTRITVGLMIAIVSCMVSYLYAMSNLSTKVYVDERVKDLKESMAKDNDLREKNLEYVRTRVDQIYEYMIEFKKRR